MTQVGTHGEYSLNPHLICKKKKWLSSYGLRQNNLCLYNLWLFGKYVLYGLERTVCLLCFQQRTIVVLLSITRKVALTWMNKACPVHQHSVNLWWSTLSTNYLGTGLQVASNSPTVSEVHGKFDEVLHLFSFSSPHIRTHVGQKARRLMLSLTQEERGELWEVGHLQKYHSKQVEGNSVFILLLIK